MNILITGAKGFIGRNLTATLQTMPQYTLFLADIDTPEELLIDYTANADFVFHLAGINRPQTVGEFKEGNFDFTTSLLSLLAKGKKPPVVLSSSTQATLSNPYGESKRCAEEAVFQYSKQHNTPVYVYRLTNVFGKWSRPFYNTVVATFCYQISRNMPVTISDTTTTLQLVYIDDVLDEFIGLLDEKVMHYNENQSFCCCNPTYTITLGALHECLMQFHNNRSTLTIVDQSDPLIKKLHATYLSFLPIEDFSKPTITHSDHRGSFTELLHMGGYGQVSLNISKPHITKGEHWHHSKHEKFIVIQGEGEIRFRKLGEETIIRYQVTANPITVVDIPPGYTHAIENKGDTDMLTIMWANECFDPSTPDTMALPVYLPKQEG